MPQYVTVGTLKLGPGQRPFAEGIADHGVHGMAQMPGFVSVTFFLDEAANEYGAYSVWESANRPRPPTCSSLLSSSKPSATSCRARSRRTFTKSTSPTASRRRAANTERKQRRSHRCQRRCFRAYINSEHGTLRPLQADGAVSPRAENSIESYPAA